MRIREWAERTRRSLWFIPGLAMLAARSATTVPRRRRWSSTSRAA